MFLAGVFSRLPHFTKVGQEHDMAKQNISLSEFTFSMQYFPLLLRDVISYLL
jgi:hypothetical protein